MNDPKLAAIATRLQETASYAINPEFKERLRKDLLEDLKMIAIDPARIERMRYKLFVSLEELHHE